MQPSDVEATKRFKDGTHHLWIIFDQDDKFIRLETSKRKVTKGKAIDKYVEKVYEPLTYINYFQYRGFVQLDGITALVGMSGAGKTYSALSMLPTYANHFNKIAYLNYELTDRDIISRFKKMHTDDYTHNLVLPKLYIKEGIMTSLDLSEVLEAMDVMPEDKVVFIIDNVGSVIGQEQNAYHLQNDFLKELDVICKDRGFHALALTQTVKDNGLDIFDDNGDIKPSITMSIMSGSIMLGNLARTVLFTGYNGNLDEYKVKILKKGTGLLYSDKGVDRSDKFISR